MSREDLPPESQMDCLTMSREGRLSDTQVRFLEKNQEGCFQDSSPEVYWVRQNSPDFLVLSLHLIEGEYRPDCHPLQPGMPVRPIFATFR